jgi:hypothetical protein
MVTHGGGLAGQVSRTALLPEQVIGLLVCSNTKDAPAWEGIPRSCQDAVVAFTMEDEVAKGVTGRQVPEDLQRSLKEQPSQAL